MPQLTVSQMLKRSRKPCGSWVQDDTVEKEDRPDKPGHGPAGTHACTQLALADAVMPQQAWPACQFGCGHRVPYI